MPKNPELVKGQADRLKAILRENDGMAASRLAESIGMSRSQLSSVIRADLGLPFRWAIKIGEHFNIDPEWIMYGNGVAPEWYKNVPIDITSEIGNNPIKIDFPQSNAAEIIRRIRAAFDISQSELAKRIGITKDLLLKIEHGKRNVTLLTWVLLAHYLNTKLSNEEYKTVKRIVEEVKSDMGTGFNEDDDDDYKSRSSEDAIKLEKQIAFLQDIIDTQKTLLDQKDIIIKQLSELNK